MKKEIELKYRLASKDDFVLFNQFLDAYAAGPKAALRQENYYFDTPSLSLKHSGISLRLRRQNNENLICGKQSVSQKKPGKHLSVRLEYEGPVDTAIAALIHDGYLSPMDVFSSLQAKTADELATQKTLYRHMKKAAKTGLQMIGSFVNMRTAIPVDLLGQRILMELDQSTYPKSIEIFEVEVEFTSVKQVMALRPAIENLFRAAHVKTYRSSSKSSRLYRILFG